MEKQWIIFYLIVSSHMPYGVKFFFFYVWYTVDDAKDGCFSSLCMEKLFGDTLFFILEYGAGLFDVANLEGKKYLHF